MANDANINIVGTVLQDPTNRQVNSSTVLSMRVAVQTTKKQQNSPYPASDIYDVSVWGKMGENLLNKVKAKTRVWVSGDFMVGEPWKNRNGETQTSLRINATHVKILGGGSTSNNNNYQQATEPVDEEAPF